MEKTWLSNYPEGVPENLNVDQLPENLVAMLTTTVKKFGDHEAFVAFGSSMTYDKFWKKSRKLAIFLQKKLGLKKGDRIALMMPNIMQYPIALFASWMCGLVVVNVNPLYTAPELVKQLRDADVATIIVLANFAHELQHAVSETRVRNVIVTEVGDACGFIKSFFINFVARHIKKKVPDWEIYGAIPWRSIFMQVKFKKFDEVALIRSDVAFLQYTGGTTGVSKGAVLTHSNLLANIEQCALWFKDKMDEGKEIGVTVLPLYHIFALTACCLVFMRIGGTQVFVANPRDMKEMVRAFAARPFTIFMGLTTLFSVLLGSSEFKRLKFNSLKLTIAGGMAMQGAVAEKWQELTGSVVLQGYGLTEASPVVAMNPLTLKTFNGSIGLPVPGTEISIRDDDGNEVPFGSEGEVWVRGPQVMQGYWHQERETQLVLTPDGWLKTGDIAITDERGFFYIVDRKKDMILVAGFNVYPSEVEAVIAAHPEVLEVAVIGEPSTHAGELVKAFVVRRDDTLTKDKLIAFCKDRLTSYKVPKRLEFRSSLPKSNVGKVLRRALREGVNENGGEG